MTDFYDKEGQPIPMMEWAALLRDETYKRVAETNVDELWVSTVWIGMDHSIDGSKLIFETMVFRVGDGSTIKGPVRYSTEKAARAGHDWVVKRLRGLGRSENGR